MRVVRVGPLDFVSVSIADLIPADPAGCELLVVPSYKMAVGRPCQGCFCSSNRKSARQQNRNQKTCGKAFNSIEHFGIPPWQVFIIFIIIYLLI
jgi:hypothetical protein